MESSIFQDNIGTDYLMEKKLEIMIDINNKKIANEINSLKNMIIGLRSEISEVKRNIDKVKIADKPTGCEIFKEPSIEVSKPIATVASELKDNKQVKPRYGEYTPQDVSIEKFFYSGSGKR